MADNETLTLQFDDLEAEATTFRADTLKRTISGVVVPWGAVAKSGGQKWRFSAGSLRWGRQESRVKLNLNHDHDKPIGVAVRLEDRPLGLDATFQIGRGNEGDRILALAEDRILDGFSIEVDFERDSYQPGADDKTINDVRSAHLRGVALTHEPAFDDARVVSIQATRDKEKEMATKAETEEDADLDKNAQFRSTIEDGFKLQAETTKNAFEGLGKIIGDSIIAAVADLGPEQRHVPMPHIRFTNDPPVYQFGKLGIAGPSIVRDAYHAAYNRDEEALDRLRRYQGQTNSIRQSLQQSSAQFTTVTTGNASQVIPPGYRPDLYVPELFQGRPATDALSRGTIDNASPFTVPVFTSATGASGTHTEGTNPTDGSIVFGTKTVSPTAQSGILNLSREVVDSANPAIDAIAFAAMREEYSRDTEALTIAMLENATLGLGGTIGAGTGLVPSGAQALNVTLTTLLMQPLVLGSDTGGIRAAMARYPFLRFASPTRALMSQAATSALATASAGAADATPLLPSIGPTQSVGTGNAITQGWMIDSLPFIPCWALPGTTSDIIMLNMSDAWCWESPLLSFRYEEKLGPAIIQLALFGYFAVHVLRPVGLSGLRGT